MWFPIFMLFISLLASLHWPQTPLLFSTEVAKLGILACVLDVRIKTFQLSRLRMMLPCRFFINALYQWGKFLLFIVFWQFLAWRHFECCFFLFIEIIKWFFSFAVNVVNYTNLFECWANFVFPGKIIWVLCVLWYTW